MDSNAPQDRHPLYQAALDADEAYQRELVRVYGETKAGDKRYLYPWQHADAAVTMAALAYHKASENWHCHMTKPWRRNSK